MTAALAGCQHPAARPALAGAPGAATDPLLHPRAPIDRAGGWTLAAAEDPSLDTDEERFALTILQRHPCGLPRAAVRETAKAVVAEAHDNGLDPLLVLALIRVESTNWNWSRSEKDARGLMQILPSTGKLLARK
ncbi:MAG TPA: transglycosylase SLT domain-containing protein, partial [bacterium]|nr:transglycosylase SLT domain-containing protein [bacterium]